ncbi:MAG: YebC/PmpR family DNA-binding transcriptional regulator [Pseudomonadota bacterium]|jgi:YebC/PmpR family DNA-binding regulatory protein|nr:YebC/PmpR family DNA-binding transcriptional regulator [Pseudomonadota bacterium]
MAGHSKWANIQHRKKAQDAKRGKLFTRLIREITVAVRAGGSDIEANPRLRLAMDKALAANMTKDAVDRAIKRGAGELDDTHYEEIRYEGYGPGGAAVMVDCMTDNRNRTVAEIRHAFSRHGGNLGTTGSVSFLFTEAGVLSYPPGTDEDKIMEAALEAGAEDVVKQSDGSIDVLTTPCQFVAVQDTMITAGQEPANAEVTMHAGTYIILRDEQAEKMLRLLDTLEDQDDVQNVYANADFPGEVLERLR